MEQRIPDKDMDLWVLAGQSNMLGCALHKEQVDPDPRIALFNLDNEWIEAKPPLHRMFEAVAPAYKNMLRGGSPNLTE